jgi:ribosome maturation factor RimP
MSKSKTLGLIEARLNGFLPQEGLSLYHMELAKEGRDWYLRVFIDVQPGQEDRQYIGTDDCEKVSRFLDGVLDELDPIEQNYYLEVSSPGMDRQLYTQAHYQQYTGHLVEVRLYKPWQGSKSLTATLVAAREGELVLADSQGNEIVLPRDQVALTRLAIII